MTKTWSVITAAALVCAVACKKDPPPPAPSAPEVVTAPADGRVTVRVDGEGYHPATIRARAGQAITLVFTRTTDETCGQQLVFPTQNIRRDLPLNQPVEVALTTPPSGAVNFTCGMNMYRGQLTVQ